MFCKGVDWRNRVYTLVVLSESDLTAIEHKAFDAYVTFAEKSGQVTCEESFEDVVYTALKIVTCNRFGLTLLGRFCIDENELPF